jgi:hypothetical protein
MYAWQFATMLHAADANGWTRFVSMQNHLNLIYREEEREMLPLCRAEGIGIIPYSPMARGFLAGDRKKGGGGGTTRANSDTLAAKFYYEDRTRRRPRRDPRTTGNQPHADCIGVGAVAESPRRSWAPQAPHFDDAIDALSVKLTEESMFLQGCISLSLSSDPSNPAARVRAITSLP